MKRIEIVVAKEWLNDLVDLLREARIRGYTSSKRLAWDHAVNGIPRSILLRRKTPGWS